MLKSWSSTQRNVTLSGAEAELLAAVKLCGECIGLTQLAADWSIPLMANGPLWQGNTKSPGDQEEMRVQFEESGVGESQGNAAIEWAILGDRVDDKDVRARSPGVS